MGACSAWYYAAGRSRGKNIGFGGAGGAGRPAEVRAAGTVGMRAQAVGCPGLCRRLLPPSSAAFRLLQKGIGLKSSKKKKKREFADVGRDVAAVMRQQLGQVTGLGVHRHPPLGDAGVSSADAFLQQMHRQGGTWGPPKPRAPRLPWEGCAAGAPARGAGSRNLGAFGGVQIFEGISGHFVSALDRSYLLYRWHRC